MRIIAGQYRGRYLKTLPTKDTRPTKDMVKGAIFSIIQFEINGAQVLDLFAGSGSIGIEAISRGAKRVIFNDSNKAAIKVIKENLESLKVNSNEYQIMSYDYLTALEQLAADNERFDFIYLDPPYQLKVVNDIIEQLVALKLINKKAVIMVEVERRDEEIEHQNFNLKVHKYGNTKLLVYRFNQG